MNLRALLFLFLSGAGLGAAADRPWPRATDAVTVAVYEPLRPVAARWVAAFRSRHPDEKVRVVAAGSDVAMAQLSSGTGDVAILGREATAFEAKAFEWVYQQPPGQVDLLTGSCDQPGRSTALAVFVRREDPRQTITFADLRRLLAGPAVAGGGPVYVPDTESGTGRFLRHVLLEDRPLLRWDVIHEISAAADDRAGGAADPSAAVLAALRRGPAGVALAGNIAAVPAELRRLAVAGEGGRPVELTAQTVAARTYPLVRSVRAYFHRPTNQPVDRGTHDLLEFLLSGEGQALLTPADGYTALPAEVAAAQRAKLDSL